VLAVIDPGAALAERLESNNAAALPAPVRIAAPFSDVGIASASIRGRFIFDTKATLIVAVRNDGNQPVRGVQPVRLRLTSVVSEGVEPYYKDLFTSLKLNLKPGQSKVLRGSFVVSAAPLEYRLRIELLPDHPWVDVDPTDDVIDWGTVTVSFRHPINDGVIEHEV
jgi:hypothetical protein